MDGGQQGSGGSGAGMPWSGVYSVCVGRFPSLSPVSLCLGVFLSLFPCLSVPLCSVSPRFGASTGMCSMQRVESLRTCVFVGVCTHPCGQECSLLIGQDTLFWSITPQFCRRLTLVYAYCPSPGVKRWLLLLLAFISRRCNWFPAPALPVHAYIRTYVHAKTRMHARHAKVAHTHTLTPARMHACKPVVHARLNTHLHSLMASSLQPLVPALARLSRENGDAGTP